MGFLMLPLLERDVQLFDGLRRAAWSLAAPSVCALALHSLTIALHWSTRDTLTQWLGLQHLGGTQGGGLIGVGHTRVQHRTDPASAGGRSSIDAA